MVRVSRVLPGSICDEMGVVPGTELLTVNGRQLADFLDWEFLTADDHFMLHVKSPAGEEIEYDVERPEGMPMGVTLEPPRIILETSIGRVDGNLAQRLDDLETVIRSAHARDSADALDALTTIGEPEAETES